LVTILTQNKNIAIKPQKTAENPWKNELLNHWYETYKKNANACTYTHPMCGDDCVWICAW
jgi:hypothetical protein